MEIKIIKIEGKFVIVELNSGEQRVCPKAIFPKNVGVSEVIRMYKKNGIGTILCVPTLLPQSDSL